MILKGEKTYKKFLKNLLSAMANIWWCLGAQRRASLSNYKYILQDKAQRDLFELSSAVLKSFQSSIINFQFSSVQSLSCVQLFATPWTAARQASLSVTNSWSLLKLMSIESVMPSNHLTLCHPLLLFLQSFPASGSLQMSQFFASGGQSTGASASASVHPMNIQD